MQNVENKMIRMTSVEKEASRVKRVRITPTHTIFFSFLLHSHHNFKFSNNLT